MTSGVIQSIYNYATLVNIDTRQQNFINEYMQRRGFLYMNIFVNAKSMYAETTGNKYCSIA